MIYEALKKKPNKLVYKNVSYYYNNVFERNNQWVCSLLYSHVKHTANEPTNNNENVDRFSNTYYNKTQLIFAWAQKNSLNRQRILKIFSS